MSEPEGFLARWSRRKREGEEPAPVAGRDEAQAAASETTKAQPEVQSVPAEATEPSADITKLPPIESITAATDVRAFLAPGVPVELTRAALRRAWATDPAIRDFIGLAENQWDFTAPGGAPGFGPAPDAEQIRQLLARVIGPGEPEAGTSSRPVSQATAQLSDSKRPQPLPPPVAVADAGSAASEPPAAAVSDQLAGQVLHRNIKADEQLPDEAGEEVPRPPRHGGALPR